MSVDFTAYSLHATKIPWFLVLFC